jgi:NAD(P)H dehydrogenase (quinone)
MSIVVTAANGRLGRRVVQELLERGVPAGDVVAGARDVTTLKDVAEQGVRVARADYDDPASLREAFAGADRVLLISGSEAGRRIDQHRAAVDAAVAAGVPFVAYTSILRADTSGSVLARDHRATEEYLRGSGLAWSLLRNGWYFANYTDTFAGTLERGTFVGSAGTGRVSAADHQDYAAAAAAVLTGEGHAGTVYELGGDEAFTMDELAAELSARSGRPVEYRDLRPEEYSAVLVGAGLPLPVADMLADSDVWLSRGFLEVTGGDLHRLIGRPPVTLSQAVVAALA